MSFYTTKTNKHKLGGMIILSSWLPLRNKFPGSVVGTNYDTPCFQAHGDSDPVVSYTLGQQTSTILKRFLTNHEFKTYKAMAHSSSAEELQDVKDFLHKLISEGKKQCIVNDLLLTSKIPKPYFKGLMCNINSALLSNLTKAMPRTG